MSASTYEDNALYQLAQTLAGGGHHSTAVALRLLAQAGYASVEEVDAVSDWVLLSLRGIGSRRLQEIRELTRTDWKPPSAQSIQAANWFLSAAQFALRYWPPETLASLIRGSAPKAVDGGSIDKRLGIDMFSQAVRQALGHCEVEELIRALWQADGKSGDCVCQTRDVASGPGSQIEEPKEAQDGPSVPQLTTTCPNGDGTPRDSDRFAHPRHKRLEIVRDYWAAREKGLVQNKDNWARSRYHISGKTLLSYEREFRDEGQGTTLP